MKSPADPKIGAPIVMPWAIMTPMTNVCICVGSVQSSAVGAPEHDDARRA